MTDLDWMAQALRLAERAGLRNEVPVGAVLIRDGVVLGEGWNQVIAGCDPTAHAEILALRAAGRALANYRLSGSTLYTTLEPCAMCVGALIHARVERLVFGAHDPKTGALGSVTDLPASYPANHRFAVVAGVRADEAAQLLRRFFRARR